MYHSANNVPPEVLRHLDAGRDRARPKAFPQRWPPVKQPACIHACRRALRGGLVLGYSRLAERASQVKIGSQKIGPLIPGSVGRFSFATNSVRAAISCATRACPAALSAFACAASCLAWRCDSSNLLSSYVTASSATSHAVFLSKSAPSSTPSAPGVCSLALVLLPGVAFGIPVG